MEGNGSLNGNTPARWASLHKAKENEKIEDTKAADAFSNALLGMAVAVRNQLDPSVKYGDMTAETRSALDSINTRVVKYLAPTHGEGNSEHTPWYEVRKQRIDKLVEASAAAVKALEPTSGYLDIGVKNSIRPLVEKFIASAKVYEKRLDVAKEREEHKPAEYLGV